MNSELQPQSSSLPLTTILIAILSLATIVFAALFLMSYSQASTARNTLEQAKKDASVSAATAQKKADAAAVEAQQEAPFRSYEAPSQFGSFIVKFPKNWSSRVAESATSQTQVNLSVNPDFIRYKDDQAQPVALRVRLIQQNSNSYLDNFAEAIKIGTLKKSPTSVSGQAAVLLEGHFKDSSGAAQFSRLVAVPVRDKVIIFTCENDLYLPQFDTAIAQSKIVP